MDRIIHLRRLHAMESMDRDHDEKTLLAVCRGKFTVSAYYRATRRNFQVSKLKCPHPVYELVQVLNIGRLRGGRFTNVTNARYCARYDTRSDTVTNAETLSGFFADIVEARTYCTTRAHVSAKSTETNRGFISEFGKINLNDGGPFLPTPCKTVKLAGGPAQHWCLA